MISSVIKKIFGTKNGRELKRMEPIVAHILSLEPKMKEKSDEQLRDMTAEFRQRLDNGATLDDILPEAFATVREAGRRSLEMRHFDMQMVGGMVLHNGSIAEMRTGEGKTLVATLPSYLNALPGKGVHVVTVNDYLARRDAEWMGRLHKFLGLTVGVIVHGLTDSERQQAYRADITYGQNNEFGFDYLRDNMKLSPDSMVQRPLNYAIVDETDSILIDEARTPLIISGPAEDSADLYVKVNAIIPRLKKDVDFTVDEKAHSAMLTDQGVERIEKLLGIGNLYDPKNLDYNHHVSQALRAHTLYKRDVNYLVDEGKVVIIDDHTGRKMPGRRWSDGLHQAIEAKENVEVEEENQTLATVTFQNYFRMYNKLSGMTGTAETEAEEFHKIYKLGVIVVPTNKPMIRNDMSDLVYKNEKGKFRSVLKELEDCHTRGQPVLVGTISVEKSEVISQLLKKKGVPHHVLNAKFHEMEAEIVAQAGRKGAITISTNMAGRGTDIILGGNPEFMARREVPDNNPEAYAEALARFRAQCNAEREEVLTAGGLHILGTERHESRRIDNQLRGRSGRQGDPGSSRFYLSLEDDLLRVFGAERITGIMERLGMEEDVPIEHIWVNRAIENAQRKVEAHNFDIRKNLLEYDDVMNQQRKTVYTLRRQVLEGRYAPELSEADKKAGKLPEVAQKSGDWTVETLSKEVGPAIEKLADRFFTPPDPPLRPPAGVGADGNPLPEQPMPELPKRTWRQLRGEIYRQYGALVDVERRVEKVDKGSAEAKKELVAHVTETVAASMIQQRERIYDNADGLIGASIEEICPAKANPDDWDLEALGKLLSDQFNLKIKIPYKSTDSQEIATAVWKQVADQLEKRQAALGTPFFLYFGRHFFLEEIDNAWIEHLKAMDHLREGIGLRGYGQKDPKQEYKKEGFNLFGEMMVNVQRNVAQKLFRVEIVREQEQVPEIQAKARKMVAVHPGDGGGSGTGHATADGGGGGDGDGGQRSAASGGGAPARPKQQTVRRDAPKVGRNDPCPCGSGKKFKKCHGASDEPTA